MKKLLAIMMIVFSSTTFAGLMIEPYVGYMVSSGEYEFPYDSGSKSTWDSSTNAPVIGARLGYKKLFFWAALDYSIANGQTVDLERTGSATFSYSGSNRETLEMDVNSTTMGLSVGIDLPLIRAFASYYFASEIEVDKDSTPNFARQGDTYDGDGFGVGVGVSIMPFISINLEYRMLDYDAERPNNNDSSYTYKIKPQSNEILLSLSLPLSI